MKKLLSLLTITLLLASAPIAMAADEITVIIDGNPIEFDVPPMIINDRTMVPMRATLESLGADVNWDDSSKTAIGTAPGICVQIPINSDTIYRSTIKIPTDTPATIIDGRTLIPLRVVSECFGRNVSYDASTRTVTITNKNLIGNCPWNDKYTYYGELLNGQPNGYGELYNNITGQIGQMGIYKNNQILQGTNYNSDGSMFSGDFLNGEISQGVYSYSSGDFYNGSFSNNMKNGQGTYYWSDGESVSGNWKDDNLDGRCTYYYADGSVKYSTIMYNGKTAQEAYDLELLQLNTDYQNKLSEIYAMQEELTELINTDPYSTDEAKAILSKYDLSAIYGKNNQLTGGAAANGGNVDSYSAANAMRQQTALYAQAQEMVLKAYNAKIEAMRQQIAIAKDAADNWYSSGIAALKAKYNIN